MIIFQRAWLAWYYKSVINLGLDHLLSVRITQFRYSPRAHLALNILLFICLLFKDTLHNMDTCCSSTSKIFCSSSQTLSLWSHKYLFHCQIFPHMHNDLHFLLCLYNSYSFCKTQFPTSSPIPFISLAFMNLPLFWTLIVSKVCLYNWEHNFLLCRTSSPHCFLCTSYLPK